MTFKLNQDAPDFELPTVSGNTFSFSNELKETDDQWNLIVYFRGSWCPACMSELDDFQESMSYFNEHNIRLITVTNDAKESLEKMVKEHDFTFPVLIDENLDFLSSYGVHYHDEHAPYEDHGTHGEPAYFLTDEKGKVLYQQRQTSPFGRPHPNELRKTIKYIRNNLK
ncbi:peroxiredoxin family protein [Halobacillus litoralis]|uniref:peroxiredoxin family protein n=1 Tax=Halobacillus litoralis TaxID=45668 RepID=UPI001CFD6413|nr:redoxin domain-containing protein [Halobacillus litoralis]